MGKNLLLGKIRTFISHLYHIVTGRYKILRDVTYNDDGLISHHIVDFLKDRRFIQSYNAAKKTGGLEGHIGDIHFRAYIVSFCFKHGLSLGKGDFVECGSGKGFMATVMANSSDKFKNMDRSLYLIDTFEGIPIFQARSKDEEEMMRQLNITHFNTDYHSGVVNQFKDFTNVHVIKGIIPGILSSLKINNVAFLHIDLNNSTAEMDAINYFFDKVILGGLILLDDYAYSELFRAQKEAWDKFAKSKKIEILSLPTGQGLIIKGRGE